MPTEIPIGEDFQPYVQAALTRVRYLNSRIQLEYVKDRAVVIVHPSDSDDEAQISKEINYALYREKIYHETLSLREKFLGAQ